MVNILYLIRKITLRNYQAPQACRYCVSVWRPQCGGYRAQHCTSRSEPLFCGLEGEVAKQFSPSPCLKLDN